MKKAREKWLLTGLDLLVKKGESGLTIEVLCRELGKTKGSFYHHFASRAGYYEALLEYWEEKHTEELIAATSSESSREALGELHQLTQSLPLERETAFRNWAVNSEQAQKVVRRVDLSRVEHLKRLYAGVGKSSKASRKMAWLEYCLFLGAAQLGDTFPKTDRRELKELIQKLEESIDD